MQAVVLTPGAGRVVLGLRRCAYSRRAVDLQGATLQHVRQPYLFMASLCQGKHAF